MTAPAPAPGASAPARCRNCDAPVSGRFCASCGQSTALHPLSVWEYGREIVSHYVAAEGKLWRTLALLTLQPGRLTVEYLAGRRQRYIVPLRLYLTASFLFFALAQIAALRHAPDDIGAGAAGEEHLVERIAKAGNARGSGIIVIVEPDAEDLKMLREQHFEECLKPDAPCSTVRRWIAPALVRLQQDPHGMIERYSERFRHSLSYAMFLALPCFAALLAGAYRQRHMYYGEHLVFALHLHSFWFLLAIASVWLPEAATAFLPLLFVGYGIWALQRVYGGRWWATLLRATAITTAYALIIGLGTAALAVLLLVV